MKFRNKYPKQIKSTIRYCALEPLKTQHTIITQIVYTSKILYILDPLLVPVKY